MQNTLWTQFQGAAPGSNLGIPIHNPDLLPELIDEHHDAVCLIDGPSELPLMGSQSLIAAKAAGRAAEGSDAGKEEARQEKADNPPLSLTYNLAHFFSLFTKSMSSSRLMSYSGEKVQGRMMVKFCVDWQEPTNLRLWRT